MSATIPIEEAQANLVELIEKLKPGEEMVITKNKQPVARLIGQSGITRQPRQPGSAKGKLIIHDDDDQHLNDFRDYLP